MPTKYTDANEKVAIWAYLKTRTDLEGASITYPDPPDCLLTRNNGEICWIEVRSVYRHHELAKNLNSGPYGRVFGEHLGSYSEYHKVLINQVIVGVEEKDSKDNYADFSQKYGKGILLLYIDDPLASGDDLRVVVQANHYSEISLRNFHSVFVYVRPVVTKEQGKVDFFEGIFPIILKH